MEGTAFFLAQAAKCRRLAEDINRNDPAVAKLLALASEYEEKAIAYGAQSGPHAMDRPSFQLVRSGGRRVAMSE
jgi:hypothetical protein